jgi:hypothetical protein
MATNAFTANEIDPRVYLGDKKSSKNLPAFITHVISLRCKKPQLKPVGPSRKQMFIRARDKKHENLSSVFGICYDFIRTALEENQTNRILIHCRKGKSRSATIAMMYLMKRYDWSYRRAENNLTSIRPQTEINEGKTILIKYRYKNEEFYYIEVQV